MSIKIPDPYDAAIGANVRTLRNLKKMSQESLGKHLGLTFQQVQKYEKGANRISGSRLVHIAKLFNVGVDELCNVPDGVTIRGKRDDVITRLGASSAGIEVAEAWDSIKSPKLRRVVADVIIAMATFANGNFHKTE
jgi:transcriptional regulator with XRE-family HTH domain